MTGDLINTVSCLSDVIGVLFPTIAAFVLGVVLTAIKQSRYPVLIKKTSYEIGYCNKVETRGEMTAHFDEYAKLVTYLYEKGIKAILYDSNHNKIPFSTKLFVDLDHIKKELDNQGMFISIEFK